MLVLDEPTNDLDVETLELLEERLVQYPGHRAAGQPRSGVSQQRRHQHDRVRGRRGETNTSAATTTGTASRARKAPRPSQPKVDKKKLYKEARKASQTRKLSFKESKELESLPALIESLEGELAVLHNQLADPAFYRNPANVVLVKSA